MIFVKRKLISAGIVLVMLGWSAVGVAGVGHYLPGMFNTRDFFVPEKEGVYTALYLGNYLTNTLKDKNGNNTNNAVFEGPAGNKLTANLDTHIDLNIISPVFMWNTGYKIFGADYAMYIALPFTSTSVGATLSAFSNINLEQQANFRGTSVSGSNNGTIGLNDIYVQPLWLDWRGKHYDIAAGYGFYAPTGKYSPDGGANNIGLGFWAHQLQLAGAYYPFDNQGTALTLAGTYEINQKTAGKSFVQGSHFTLNWGIDQFLPITDDVLLNIGPAGYLQWQVQANHGADQPQFLNSNNRVYGVGGQIGVAAPKLNSQVTFHYFTEFDAQARPQGNYAGLTAALGF